MAVVRLAPPAVRDLERLAAFLRDDDDAAAGATVRTIFDGLGVLQKHPLIGRTLAPGRRELVIYRGRTGYLAQYHYDAVADEVLILAIRHQREIDG
jgi:plasmid stabilization system protein ParE